MQKLEPTTVTVEKGTLKLRYTFTPLDANRLEVTIQENDEKPYVAAQYSEHSIYGSIGKAFTHFDRVLKALY